LERLPGDEVTGAEVGVFYGKNSFGLLSNHQGLTLYLVDCWAPVPEGAGVGRNPYPNRPERHPRVFHQEFWDHVMRRVKMKMKQFGKRAIIVKSDSVEGTAKVPDALDFVFIDGDHTEEGCRRDIEAWLPKVKPGGLLCGHDWDRWGVTAAVRSVLGDKVETGGEKVKCWFYRVPEVKDADEQQGGEDGESLAASGVLEEAGDQDCPVEDEAVVQDGSPTQE
jgi:hypothetical protein